VVSGTPKDGRCSSSSSPARTQTAAGFQEVNTPEIMDRELWVKSGHIETFGENMYMTQTPTTAHSRSSR